MEGLTADKNLRSCGVGRSVVEAGRFLLLAASLWGLPFSVWAAGQCEYSADTSLQIDATLFDILDDGEVKAVEAAFTVGDIEGKILRGYADEIHRDPEGEIEVKGAGITPCAAGSEDWELGASALEIAADGRTLTAYNTVFKLFGVPVFWLPWARFPLGSDRRSGFLFPRAGYDSRNGAFLSWPFYVDLKPWLDLTLTPKVYGRTGLLLDSELRALSPGGGGKLRIARLLSDRRGGSARQFIDFAYDQEWASGWSSSLRYSAADDGWFEEIEHGGAVPSYHPHHLRVDYRGEGFWRLEFESLRHAPYDEILPQDGQPPVYDLEFAGRFYNDRILGGGWQWKSQFEVARFGNSTAVAADPEKRFLASGAPTPTKGTRLLFQPSLSWRGSVGSWWLEPAVSLWSVAYNLQGVRGDTEDALLLPRFSLRGGSAVRSRLLGGGVVEYEPQFLYLYVPQRPQDKFPLFDTSVWAPATWDLLEENRFAGGDRIGDANRLVLALDSHIFSALGDLGWQYRLGVAFDFTTPQVRLGAPPPPGLSDDASRDRGQDELSHYFFDSFWPFGFELRFVGGLDSGLQGYRAAYDFGGDKIDGSLFIEDSRYLYRQVGGEFRFLLAGSTYFRGRADIGLADVRNESYSVSLSHESCCLTFGLDWTVQNRQGDASGVGELRRSAISVLINPHF